MARQILLGIDVGTSNVKVLATSTDGREISVRTRPTAWRNLPGGRVSIDPWELVDAAVGLAARVVRDVADSSGPVQVAGIGITGMAESGALLAADGTARHDVIAWFDDRGLEQIRALPAELAAALPRIAGLPIGSQLTLAKLAWMRDQGVDLTDGQWLHVPELVAYRLTGVRAAEVSLLARTGLLDQETGALWPPALDVLGVPASFIPDRRTAGTPVGYARSGHCPSELDGAVVTIAGHDHPVAAIGCGADGTDAMFDSFGTAEVFLRMLDGPLTPAQRADLVAAGVNVVRSVLPGRWHLLGGTKSGLLMRRTLALLGADREARQRLDEAAATVSDEDVADIHVTGAANDDGVLRIAAPYDTVSPAALWLAVVRHGIAAGEALLDAMFPDRTALRTSFIAGGWTHMPSVRREKLRQLPGLRFSDLRQAGAFGAAALAACALRVGNDVARSQAGPDQQALHEFVRSAYISDERIAG